MAGSRAQNSCLLFWNPLVGKVILYQISIMYFWTAISQELPRRHSLFSPEFISCWRKIDSYHWIWCEMASFSRFWKPVGSFDLHVEVSRRPPQAKSVVVRNVGATCDINCTTYLPSGCLIASSFCWSSQFLPTYNTCVNSPWRGGLVHALALAWFHLVADQQGLGYPGLRTYAWYYCTCTLRVRVSWWYVKSKKNPSSTIGENCFTYFFISWNRFRNLRTH